MRKLVSPERAARNKLGAFYTPYPLARQLCAATMRALWHYEIDTREVVICDPACGDGAILSAARDELAERIAKTRRHPIETARCIAEEQLIGVDIDPKAVAACRELLPRAQIFEGDALLGFDWDRARENPKRPYVPRRINCFVGNPPFLGGRRISEVLGRDYQQRLAALFEGEQWNGGADLCASFLRYCAWIIEESGFGVMGFITTKTISEGDTREAGLGPLVQQGWQIYDAVSRMKWPGDAAVMVSLVSMIWLGPGNAPALQQFPSFDRNTRVLKPLWLDAAGLTDHANGLRALPPVADAETFKLAMDAIEHVTRKMRDQWDVIEEPFKQEAYEAWRRSASNTSRTIYPWVERAHDAVIGLIYVRACQPLPKDATAEDRMRAAVGAFSEAWAKATKAEGDA